jgi:para-nitrobenzyl esterase
MVKTESGAVEGEARAGHVSFRGIPYAAPPTGPRRFQPPAPPAPWTGVRDARTFGASAIQGESFAPGSRAEGATSEDCLFLNVYTPAADGGRRPVLVFVHGGAFIVGSSSAPLYDGGPLAVFGDQVVVTFNYRLGALGYLCLGDAGTTWGATPNAGLLDQVAALAWVRANIDRFGGDASNVTVFGESAGGASVLNLISTPSAHGLFHRVVAESPSNSLVLPERDLGLRCAEQLLSRLGLTFADSEKLRDVPAEAIRVAQSQVRARPSDLVGFFPVIDERSMPRQPVDLFREGGGARVPLVVGTNRDEWNLFELPTPPDTDPLPDLVEGLASQGLPAPREGIEHLVEVYRASRKERGLPHHDRAVRRALLGDLRFRIPSIRFAEAHAARGLATYAYLFTYASPAFYGALGACHALELPFVFGTLDAPLQDRFAGTGEGVRALSASMMQSWTSFARTGQPADDEAWPRFDAKERLTRIVDLTSRVEGAPFDVERKAWEEIYFTSSSTLPNAKSAQ